METKKGRPGMAEPKAGTTGMHHMGGRFGGGQESEGVV